MAQVINITATLRKWVDSHIIHLNPTIHEAYSIVEYTGNGTIMSFAVPFPYLYLDDVHVFVDGVEKSVYPVVTEENPPSPFEVGWYAETLVRFVDPPANNAKVKIQRITNLESLEVEFNNSSILNEEDLNTAFTQLLYIVQELYDALYNDFLDILRAEIWDMLIQILTDENIIQLIQIAIQDLIMHVDDELSLTSENPVQNKVITAALNALRADIPSLAGSITATETRGVTGKKIYDYVHNLIDGAAVADGNSKLVTGDMVYDAIQDAISGLGGGGSSVTVSQTVTDGDTNPVSGDAVYDFIQGLLSGLGKILDFDCGYAPPLAGTYRNIAKGSMIRNSGDDAWSYTQDVTGSGYLDETPPYIFPVKQTGLWIYLVHNPNLQATGYSPIYVGSYISYNGNVNLGTGQELFQNQNGHISGPSTYLPITTNSWVIAFRIA